MRLFKQLLTENECYKEGKKLKPTGVMWHSTGANNQTLKRYVQPDDGILGSNKNGNHWNKLRPDGRRVCVHAFIGLDKNGNVATYQTLPWDMRGWHAGGAANDTHIGFEICEDNLTNADYFNKVYKEGCELTAHLCELYNLDPMADGVIICHSEGYTRGIASNHGDVMHWFSKFGKTMNDVRKDVKAIMNGPVATSSLYRVQCGSFAKVTNAKALISKLTNDGYDTCLIYADKLYKVQCGAFSNRTNADALVAKLGKDGYPSFVTTRTGKHVSSAIDSTIRVGDRVKIRRGATAYNGVKVSSRLYDNVYTVDQLKGDRAVLGLKSICTPFKVKDLVKV